MDYPKNVHELLRAACYRRIDVEKLLDPDSDSWIRFDPELGYLPKDTVMRDGVDRSWSTYRHGPFGERAMMAYADRRCRVNTYGDSFTQCQQVSDGETWQERLAAHLGEPIRNFGIGGHGVYTMFRRAMRVENSEAAAEYLIFNVFVDDHVRNLDAARWLRTAWSDRNRPAEIAYPLHGLPWAHLRYNLESGQFEHQPGKCASADDLLALTDVDNFIATFEDDQIARLFVLQQGGEARHDDLDALAGAFGLDVDLANPETRKADAARLHVRYGIRSTMHIMEQLRPWCETNGRKLLVATSYCAGTLMGALGGGARHDQEFIDYLEAKDMPWFDAVAMHRDDFALSSLSVPDYVGGHYVKAAGAAVFGHYTPMANMLYAMGIKDTVVDWLDPKPQAYAQQ